MKFNFKVHKKSFTGSINKQRLFIQGLIHSKGVSRPHRGFGRDSEAGRGAGEEKGVGLGKL